MAVYYILMLLILVLGYILCERYPSKINKIIYLVVIFGYMWAMATFREGIGYDYQTYIDIFNEIREFNTLEAFRNSRFEIGFTMLTKLMTFFISSPIVMYGVYTVLMLVPIAIFIYKYSQNIWLSSWLYLTLAFFYNNMNFIRQSLACSICALAFGFFISEEKFEFELPFLNKMLSSKNPETGKPDEVFTFRPYKHFIPFILMALLATSFHKTAIIIIPVYIFAHIKLNKVLVALYLIATFGIYIFSEPILSFIMENTVYSYYKGSDYILYSLGGEFLLVPMTVLILCVAVYFRWRKYDKNASIMLNVSIVNATIWLFGATRHMLVERFSMYSYVYTLIIVPVALKALLATPEERLEYEQLSADIERRGNVPKSVKAKANSLAQKISDHKKYYWSAVVAVLLITFIYNYFGMYINVFHGVFPYRSIF